MATAKDLPKAMNSKTSAYSRFQKDKFYCSVCQESIFTRTETKEQHLFSKKHTIKELESTLFGPERTEDVNSFKVEYSGQSTESMRYKSSPKRDNAALTATLRKISADFGLTSKELEFRRSVFDYVQTSLISEDVDVGLELSLFGSSLTGAGLTGSNIDICLKATSSNSTTEAMLRALSSIEEDGRFLEVKDYLHKTPPRFSFEDAKNGLKCIISCGPEAEEALETSRMIERYMHLDAKVLILSQCFRYWAKVCQIDRKHEGTLSPYCFVLMVIHFLQTRHLVPLAKDVWKGKWTKEHDQPLSQLWVDLLRYYKAFLKTDECVVSIESFSRISKASQNWYHPFAIADPNVRGRNVANSLSKKVMDYFKSCFDKSFKYFNKELPKSNGKPGERKPRCSTMTTSESEIESENVESLLDYDSDDESESEDDSSDEIAQSLKTNDEESLITFEDDDEKTDESENVDENENLDERENIDESKNNGENDGESDVKGENEDESQSSSSDDKYKSYNDYVIVEYDRAPLVEVESSNFSSRDKSNNALSSCGEENTPSLIGHFDDLRLIDFEASSSDAQQSQPRIRSSTSTSLEVETLYDFNRKNLCKEESAPSFCCTCKCLGHRRDDCSQVKKIVEPISAPNSTTKKALGIICDAVHEMLKPSPPDLDLRSSLLQQLQSYLCRDIPKAHLSLFGSSSNGLGFRSSDMDICIFMKDISEEYVNKTWLIKKLERLLRKCKFVGHLQVIRSAKIPIIKFMFVDGSVKLLEADLSLYNVLALENTRLISTYCCLDWRVRTLGYALKYFAKQCEIGDASRGTLSSYAHTMMLIHYLQQRNPPVVPVIQELGFAGKSKPQRLVDGWNTWFITDLNALFELWPGSGKNKESLGKLWLGFFRYYVEDFDFKRNVITIRQSKPLRKFEKDWNRFDMAIEDPFQLDRNLSAGITTKVFKYISGIFAKARKLYSAAIDENFIQLNGKQHAISHFFNADYLCKDLKMPLDRLCRRCGKIGHTRKTCNMKPATNKKNKKKPREDGKQGQGVASEDVEAGESHRKDVEDGEASDPLNTASQRKASGDDEKRQSEERFEKSALKNSQGTDTDNQGRKILKAVRNRGKGSKGTQSNQNDDEDSLFKSRQADVRPRATGKRVAGSSTDGFSIGNVYRDNDYTESGSIPISECLASLNLTKETSNTKPTRGSNKIQNKSDLLEEINKLMKKAEALPPDDHHRIAVIQDEISVYEDKIQLAAVEKFSSRENASNSRIEFSIQNEASFEDEADFQNQADLQNDAALQSQARGPSGKKKNKKKSEKTKPSPAGREQAVFSEAAGHKEVKPGGKSKNKKDGAKSKQHIGSKESILSVEEHVATFAGDRSMPDKSEGENFHEKVPEGKGKEKRQRQRKEKKNLPPGANAIQSQPAAAQKAQKGVVRTNLGREDSLFLSMLDISPVVDFTKGKLFIDDTSIGKSRTQERGTHQTRDGHQDFGSQDREFNGPEPYRSRGHPRGSPRGRGRGGRGQGIYHQGRQNDGQSEDRGRGHRSEDRGRGHRSEDRGRGHRSEDRGRGRGHSRGHNQARGQGHRGGRANVRGGGRGQARGQYGERSNSSSFSDY